METEYGNDLKTKYRLDLETRYGVDLYYYPECETSKRDDHARKLLVDDRIGYERSSDVGEFPYTVRNR